MNAQFQRSHPCFGYQSEIAGLIDMVERGCARLRRVGGGGLVREYSHVPQKNITHCEHVRMNEYVLDGKNIMEISTLMNRSKHTVAVHTRETRWALNR